MPLYSPFSISMTRGARCHPLYIFSPTWPRSQGQLPTRGRERRPTTLAGWTRAPCSCRPARPPRVLPVVQPCTHGRARLPSVTIPWVKWYSSCVVRYIQGSRCCSCVYCSSVLFARVPVAREPLCNP
jgi:hypothetical protein